MFKVRAVVYMLLFYVLQSLSRETHTLKFAIQVEMAGEFFVINYNCTFALLEIKMLVKHFL